MYCTRCGTVNRDDSSRCSSCSHDLSGVAAGPPPRVPNNLVSAVVTTLCCCLPVGVVSIVYAVQSNARLEAGDYVEALEKYRLSRTWSWVAFGLGLTLALLQLLVGVISEMQP